MDLLTKRAGEVIDSQRCRRIKKRIIVKGTHQRKMSTDNWTSPEGLRTAVSRLIPIAKRLTLDAISGIFRHGAHKEVTRVCVRYKPCRPDLPIWVKVSGQSFTRQKPQYLLTTLGICVPEDSTELVRNTHMSGKNTHRVSSGTPNALSTVLYQAVSVVKVGLNRIKKLS